MVRGRASLALTIAALVLIALLPSGPVGNASAQEYSFSVSEERVNVTVMQDGSVDIDYLFVFTNVGYLDGVDVGMPNSLYDLSTAVAHIVVNGHERAPRQIRSSPYVHPGVAVEFDPATVSEVQGGGSFTLYLHINNPHMVYTDPHVADRAGIAFTPTWFDATFRVGNTAC